MVVIISASCHSRPEPEAIIAGIQPLEHNSLLFVAESRSFFEKNGLKVIIRNYDNGVDSIKALLNKEVDIASSVEFPFIKPVLKKQAVRIIAISDRFENHYLIIRKGSGINNAADLKGKKIGVIRGTGLEFYLGRYLKLHGIDPGDVIIADTMNSYSNNEAIINGKIDAVVAFQPHVSFIQNRLNNKVIIRRIQNHQLTYGILVSRTDVLNSKSDLILRFLKALKDAEYYWQDQPYESRIIVQESLKLDESYLAGTWPMHRFSLSLDFSLIIAMNDEARWMINNNLTAEKTIPDFRNYIYVDALKKVKPDAVNIIQ